MAEAPDQHTADMAAAESTEPTHGPEQIVCPMPETHDKFDEAHFFIEQMMTRYHEPEPFRWCLNAFIQALRSVTFRLQKELTHRPGFEEWYGEQQAFMKDDQLLRAFVEGRNLVVKERNLILGSSAHIGYFRYRKPKIWLPIKLDPQLPSSVVLRNQVPKLALIPEDHPATGEEYGVQRDWHSEDIGEGNLLELCDKAWSRIGTVVVAAHEFVGLEWEGPPEHGHDPAACNLLTETDLDSTLAEKWGWS